MPFISLLISPKSIPPSPRLRIITIPWPQSLHCWVPDSPYTWSPLELFRLNNSKPVHPASLTLSQWNQNKGSCLCFLLTPSPPNRLRCFPVWPLHGVMCPLLWGMWLTNCISNSNCLLICEPYQIWIRKLTSWNSLIFTSNHSFIPY